MKKQQEHIVIYLKNKSDKKEIVKLVQSLFCFSKYYKNIDNCSLLEVEEI